MRFFVVGRHVTRRESFMIKIMGRRSGDNISFFNKKTKKEKNYVSRAKNEKRKVSESLRICGKILCLKPK